MREVQPAAAGTAAGTRLRRPAANKMLFDAVTQEWLYCIAAAVYVGILVYQQTYWSSLGIGSGLLKLLRYGCYFCAVWKMARDSYRTKDIGILLAAFLICGAAVMHGGNKRFIFFLLMIAASRDVPSRPVLRAVCFSQIVILLVTVISSQLGLTTNYIFLKDNLRIRYGLGFTWTTTAPILFFFWQMNYALLRREKMTLPEYVILELVNFWLYKKTNTRACFFLATLTLLVFFFLKMLARVQKKHEWLEKGKRWNSTFFTETKGFGSLLRLAALSPAFFCVLSIALHAVYNPTNRFLYRLNNALTGRLKLGRDGITKYGIHLFGTKVRWVGNSIKPLTEPYNYVDCSYLQILLEFGVLVLALAVAAYCYMLARAAGEHDLWFFAVLFVITGFSMTEPRLLQLGFNPVLLLCFSSGFGQMRKGNL
ncbi:MAG: hypothetical protein Q4B09_11225 [Lachnospiraceae bacterium]|nr:hypothetical protein [Lachnospiraceae bacterium]